MGPVSRVWVLFIVVAVLSLSGCVRTKPDTLLEEVAGPDGEVVLGEEPAAGSGEEGQEGAEATAAPEGAEPTAAGEAAPEDQEEAAPTEGAVEPAESQPTTAAPTTAPESAATSTTEGAPATPTEPSPPTPAQGTTVYTVRVGDTLTVIAQSFETTAQELQRLNNLSGSAITAGQELQVPVVNPDATAPAEGPIIHVVQPGEWLWAIARRYNTTPDAIIAANNLAGATIYSGQQLIIPTQ